MNKLDVVVKKSIDREWDGYVASEFLPYIHVAQGDSRAIWELLRKHHHCAQRYTLEDLETALMNLEKWDMVSVRWPRKDGEKERYVLTSLGVFHLRQQLTADRIDMTFQIEYD